MTFARASSISAVALASIGAFVLLLPGCCCTETRYDCQVCVAKPACRYCVDVGRGSTESAAILDGKKTLCEGLVNVAVPGLDTTTAANCIAAPEQQFATQCRKEGHVGGPRGGRLW